MSALAAARQGCTCRACIAKSLARALRQIDHGRHLVAARIILFALMDLTRGAVWITTGPGTKAPLCENDRRHQAGRMFQAAGIELVVGRE